MKAPRERLKSERFSPDGEEEVSHHVVRGPVEGAVLQGTAGSF